MPKKYVIISHHPRDSHRSGCASVYHAFLSHQAVYPYSDYINVSLEAAEFDQQLRQKISNDAVVVFNGAYSLMSWPNAVTALQYAENSGVPVIVYWHETAWNLNFAFRNQGKRETLLKYLSKDNVKHWATSSQCKQLLMYIFKCSYEDVKVVYEAIPILDTPLRPRENRGVVSLCGSGYVEDLRKGVDYFIEISKVLPELNGTPCKYDWYWDVESNRVKELYGDTGNVCFPGFVDDFSEILGRHDIFLLTSRDDPSPLVALEALAADLPVFCFDAVGTTEIMPPEFVAASPAGMIENIRRYWARSDIYPPGFFRDISRRFSVENFVARVTHEDNSLRPSAFRKLFEGDPTYTPLSALASRLTWFGVSNEQLLRYLATNPVANREIAEIISAWFNLDPGHPSDDNPDLINLQDKPFYNYFRCWISSEAAQILAPGTVATFQTMWKRRYVTTARLADLTSKAVRNNPAIRRIVISGLGTNGRKVLARLRQELSSTAVQLCAWDDGISAENCAELGVEKVDPRQWRQWPEDCLAVMTPLDDAPFREHLCRLNASWQRDVITGEEHTDEK